MNLANIAVEARDNFRWNSAFHGFLGDFKNMVSRKLSQTTGASTKEQQALQNHYNAVTALSKANQAINDLSKKESSANANPEQKHDEISAYCNMQARVFEALGEISQASSSNLTGLKRELTQYAQDTRKALLNLLGLAPNRSNMKGIMTNNNSADNFGIGGHFIKSMAK